MKEKLKRNFIKLLLPLPFGRFHPPDRLAVLYSFLVFPAASFGFYGDLCLYRFIVPLGRRFRLYIKTVAEKKRAFGIYRDDLLSFLRYQCRIIVDLTEGHGKVPRLRIHMGFLCPGIDLDRFKRVQAFDE